MSSNYGYGYGQSSLYANYGYGGGAGGGAPGQQVMPPAPPVGSTSVGYGGSINQGYGYNYYQQQQQQTANSHAGGTAQSYATPTTSSNSSSVMYPTDYYQYARAGSYSYQPQTTVAPQTISTSYSQTHTSYSQTGSYQSQAYTSYSQAGTGSYQPQTYTSYSQTGTGSYQPQTGTSSYQPQTYTSYSQTGTSSYQPQTGTGSYQPQTGTGSYQPQTYTSYSQIGSLTNYGSYSMATPTSNSGTFSSMTPQQQQVIQEYVVARERGGGGGKVKTQAEKNFLKKKTYDSEQNYYCEVCKVGCGSALTYKTHLEGKNHKRRLQLQQKTNAAPPRATDASLKCDVCEVFCSSKDSYLAHVRGSKHLKTVALFRRLGKPLPPMTSVTAQDDGGVQVTGPRITFVGGKKLSSTGLTLEPKPEGTQVYPPGAPEPAVKPNINEPPPPPVNSFNSDNVEPVGLDLVKPVKNHPKSPLSSYHCELCDCFFNDDLARISHCKGRRHRINYKDAYDPTLKVDKYKASTLKKKQKDRMAQDKKRIASGNFARGGSGWGGRGKNKAEELFRLRQQEASAIAALHYGVEEEDYYHHPSDDYEDYHEYHHFSEPYPSSEDWNPNRSFQIRNPADDKMVSTKYGQLYPSDSEIKATQKAVLDIEAALKSCSDDLLMETCKRAAKEKDATLSDLSTVKKDEALREIKGVMRVGLHAYDLLVRGRMEINLIVICAHIPTKDLLVEIHDLLPAKLVATDEATYHVSADFKKGELMIISNTGDVTVTVLINLTSYAIEDASASQFSGQELNPSLCLSSLMALRQTNWFQANCQGMPSFSIVMRIFLDLKRRKTAFSVMTDWVLLILVHKCITSAPPNYLRPGDIFRRVIECIASGVFLPGYPGLRDPSGGADAAASMTAQERADLTLLAQHFLRLIAFNQLHIVLDMSPPPNYAPYSLKISPDSSIDPDEEEGEGERSYDREGEGGMKRMKLDHI